MILRSGLRRKYYLIALAVIAAFSLLTVVGSVAMLAEANVVVIDTSDVVSERCCDNSQSAYETPTLRVAIAAMISPETTKAYYGDLMRLIGKRMGRRTVFLQRKTYAEVNDLLEHKEVDVAFVCAGPYVAGKQEFGMEILAVPVVNGRSSYQSYIIASKNTDITQFDDLKGRRFAYTDPDSNTGNLVPRFMVSKRGFKPETFFDETFYTNSHDNSIRAVADGMADGAAVDSLVWEFMNATDPTFTSKTRVVHTSPLYGIPPVAVHPDFDPALKETLRGIFMELHTDPEAMALMNGIRIERFVPGDDRDYDTVRDMRRWVSDRKQSRK